MKNLKISKDATMLRGKYNKKKAGLEKCSVGKYECPTYFSSFPKLNDQYSKDFKLKNCDVSFDPSYIYKKSMRRIFEIDIRTMERNCRQQQDVSFGLEKQGCFILIGNLK